ncbi:MAG: BolA family transcriptional regulator [Alphaproteobacteria bacterium]|nr:BolA family transcriptional regulator [Alphaproteobacteria bacterium]
MERPDRINGDVSPLPRQGAVAERPTAPIAGAVYDRLIGEFSPTRLEIIDESSQHRHHVAMKHLPAEAGDKTHPKGRETHFRIVMESEKLRGLSRVAQHQLVYKILQTEMARGIHALSLDLRVAAKSAK